MGTSALMSLGMRAMFANYAALQTTGHNISNANTEGYSRQDVQLKTSGGQFTGAGFFGKGVDIAAVTRSHDAFLTREAATSKSLAALDSTRLDQLERLESVFGTGERGIGYAAGQFLNGMVDLASNPQDASARAVVLARAQEVANRFATAGGQLDSLQLGVTEDLNNTVAQVNELAQRLAEVNQRIIGAVGSGQAPNDLLDQRDLLVSQLSEHVQVTTVMANDGSMGVFVAGGQRLVLGNQASQLAVTQDATDGSRSAVGIVENGQVRPLPEGLLGGGSITGLLRFQNEELAAARNALGQMAAALAGAVNRQQSLGLDLRSPPGSGAPIFSVGAPQALPNANNARDAGGNFVSSISLATVDASQLQASEYDLRADPASPGNYTLTRLSDGLVRTVASGATVDGFRITVNAPAPAATDRFRLQPVTRAANDMRRVLDQASGLAAASPLSATVAAGNTGTASVASLAVVSPAADPQNTATISFTNGSGAYNWELRDRTTNALVSSGSGTWSAGQPIALNGFELSLNGVPAAGDGFTVGMTQSVPSNNGNALAFAALRESGMVDGRSITDAYAAAMSAVGVQVQGARAASEISERVASAAEDLRASKAGVNLDEEAARLIQFQQSYQAAAKVLQVAQSIFDTLLDTAAA